MATPLDQMNFSDRRRRGLEGCVGPHGVREKGQVYAKHRKSKSVTPETNADDFEGRPDAEGGGGMIGHYVVYVSR